MTISRRLLKKQTHMISRRCSERRFFLKPTKLMRKILTYALGEALREFSVELYAFMFEANHYHLIAGDPEQQLSKFMHRFDQLVARSLNAHYGRGEAFWAPGPYSNTEIHDEETLIRKLVYVYANPVKDGLVSRPEEWPGLHSLPEDMGTRTFTVEKPDGAFFGGKRPKYWISRGARTGAQIRREEARVRREQNRARAAGERKPRAPRCTLPPEVSFAIKVPLSVDVDDRDDFVRRVRATLEHEIASIHEERALAGKTQFMGAEAIRQLDPFKSAGDTFPTFRLNPRIACGDKELRIQLLHDLKVWRHAYKAALEEWRNGNRDVVFPEGTIQMKRLHRCKVGELPLLG